MTVLNLDATCAALGHELGTSGQQPKDTENSITKALGVLEEQGVYAMFLYLHAREKGRFSKSLVKFLRSDEVGLLQNTQEHESFVALQKLAKNLDDLLFARELLHQVLVYARYHAKAAGASVAESSRSTSSDTGPGGDDRPEKRQERPQRERDRTQTEAGK